MEYFPLFIQFDTACHKHRCIGCFFVVIFMEPTGSSLLLQHNIFVLAASKPIYTDLSVSKAQTFC
jgi:hypothetical protein